METAEALVELNKIFKKKGWFEKDESDLVFEDFVTLLVSLNKVQRRLIIELTERYLWISDDEYGSKIKRLYEEIIEDNLLDGIDTIYLFPISKLKDEHKAKSGTHIVYLHRCMKRKLRALETISIKSIESFQVLREHDFVETEKLFLVDDFIGTGSTLKETLREIKVNKSISENMILILSIVTQQMATEYISQTNMRLYSCETANKGITNFYSDSEIVDKVNIMTNIENKICGISDYRFGYMKSEALVTLARTPNNTFPIFWADYYLKRKIQRAPFPRD